MNYKWYTLIFNTKYFIENLNNKEKLHDISGIFSRDKVRTDSSNWQSNTEFIDIVSTMLENFNNFWKGKKKGDTPSFSLLPLFANVNFHQNFYFLKKLC